MFNKKSFGVILLVLIGFSILLLFTLLFVHNKSNKSIQTEKISILPDFELTSYDGNIYSLKNQKKKYRTIVLFFSPDCELCEKEINDIILNKELFKEVRWLFITQSILANEMRNFLTLYPLSEIDNSVILLENWPKYNTMYEVSGPPAMFVYDREGKLIHSARGAVSIDVIKKWLQ